MNNFRRAEGRNCARPIHALWFAVLLAGAGGGAQAAPPWYQVELIIFEQHEPGALASEHWPLDPPMPPLERALELTPAGGATLPYQRVPPSRHGLESERRRIERSADYRVIWHGAWHQPGNPRANARPVHIFAGRDLGPEVGGSGQARWELDGTAALGRGRYLHLDLDLVLHKHVRVEVEPPATDEDRPGEAPAPKTAAANVTGGNAAPAPMALRAFRLHESRRMRSGELHYYDHPLFGVVARVIER